MKTFPSRFNFSLVKKPRRGASRIAKTTSNPDAIRLTNSTLIIGTNLRKRFLKPGATAATIQIEKDPERDALRVTVAHNSRKLDESTYRVLSNPSKSDLHTQRPVPLYDMLNGCYVEDLKEPWVFVREGV